MGNKSSKQKNLNKQLNQESKKLKMKLLCFNHESYIAINDEYINSIFENKSFTLECWAFPNISLVNSKPHMILFGQKAENEGGAHHAMHFGIFNYNNIGMRYNCNDLNINVGHSSKLKGFHHYAFVYDHTTHTREIFFDGKFLGSDKTTAHLQSTGRFMVGRSPWNSNDDWGGYIRDVRVWNTARSDKEIAEWFDIFIRSKKDLKQFYTDHVSLISKCDIFQSVELKDFPSGIIRFIVEYDGLGLGNLKACFPLILDENDEDTKEVTDIVSDLGGKLTGPLFWDGSVQY